MTPAKLAPIMAVGREAKLAVANGAVAVGKILFVVPFAVILAVGWVVVQADEPQSEE